MEKKWRVITYILLCVTIIILSAPIYYLNNLQHTINSLSIESNATSQVLLEIVDKSSSDSPPREKLVEMLRTSAGSIEGLSEHLAVLENAIEAGINLDFSLLMAQIALFFILARKMQKEQ